MKRKTEQPLKIALYGMDDRSCKTMQHFLQGPCKGVAVVVEPENADVDLLDADAVKAKEILQQRQQAADRPIIAMSLEVVTIDKVIYLKKPVTKADLLNTISQCKKICQSAAKQNPPYEQASGFNKKEPLHKVQSKPVIPPVSETGSNIVDSNEQKKTAKHKTSRQLTEGGFINFLGIVPDVDFSVEEQALGARYNPGDYYQGYVHSAITVANSKGRVMQMNCNWKPMIIFPKSHEIWVDADETMIRSFAGIKLNKDSGFSLHPADLQKQKKLDLNKFQSIEAFLWKLAIWTSKGRYPDKLDIEKPVYLSRWPNFTRLVITPHALRITALLIQQPQPLLHVARVLNIKPQYVFVFISACMAIGIAGQAVRRSDHLIAAEKPEKTKKSGLFQKIMTKLRMAK